VLSRALPLGSRTCAGACMTLRARLQRQFAELGDGLSLEAIRHLLLQAVPSAKSYACEVWGQRRDSLEKQLARAAPRTPGHPAPQTAAANVPNCRAGAVRNPAARPCSAENTTPRYLYSPTRPRGAPPHVQTGPGAPAAGPVANTMTRVLAVLTAMPIAVKYVCATSSRRFT
jgi:hypothetical protein